MLRNLNSSSRCLGVYFTQMNELLSSATQCVLLQRRVSLDTRPHSELLQSINQLNLVTASVILL
jgi:hypothetical protein